MSPLIEVVPYNEEWPKIFAAEAKLVSSVLGGNCICVYHIGSTSISGLAAKPIIDILPVVRDILKVDLANQGMENIGYIPKGENGIPNRRYFQKAENHQSYNVHVFAVDNPLITKYLIFSEWLRSHPDDRHAYEKLKLNLAAKFPYDMSSYNQGKADFIAKIEEKAANNI